LAPFFPTPRQRGEPRWGAGGLAASIAEHAMKIIVNDAERDVAAATLAAALEALDYAGAIVATALNGHFVPARARGATPIKEGDRIEIVAPRQGG
jgi:sulfur carrier protein